MRICMVITPQVMHIGTFRIAYPQVAPGAAELERRGTGGQSQKSIFSDA